MVLIGANTSRLSFIAPDVKVIATLGFRLQVDDGSLISAPASATVLVQKHRGNHGDDDRLVPASTARSPGAAPRRRPARSPRS